MLAVNTMIRHELASSGYRDRVEECNEAARLLGVASLRDAKLEDVEKLAELLKRRARHVITENLRVERFVVACENGEVIENGAAAGGIAR